MTCIVNNGTIYDNVSSGSFVIMTRSKCQLNRLEDIIGVVQEINNFQYNNSEKKYFVSLNVKDLINPKNLSLWSGASQFQITFGLMDGILWSGASQFTPIGSFVHKAKCVSLSELCKVKQDVLCVTVGTTQNFFVSKHGWFYYGCTKCSLKASAVNNPYKCSCGQNVEHAIPRYRVDIYVIDGESKFRFVFWDTDCTDTLGKSVDSIYKAMVEEDEDDPMIYPDELDKLGKKMAFRAKVQPTFGQAYVWKLSYDEEFVKEIEKDYITNEGDSIPLTQNPVVDCVDDSIESLSAYGENDPDKVVTSTPSKGSPITLDVEDSECQPYGATQLSGTRPSKKVKIESNA
ncbi:uncharacterized protein LOC131625758 [Vicia villosa]|uniref:uncharacterized protein LOC131625758 n=1 Tax=Vicia villosa TaxID=3911 RepID=UPI00273BF201|nr:uncharacterized protein LOC131625758 [Vicia villosa]